MKLDWNSITSTKNGFSSFIEGITINKTLQHLDITNCQIGQSEAKELAVALTNNSCMQILGKDSTTFSSLKFMLR